MLPPYIERELRRDLAEVMRVYPDTIQLPLDRAIFLESVRYEGQQFGGNRLDAIRRVQAINDIIRLWGDPQVFWQKPLIPPTTQKGELLSSLGLGLVGDVATRSCPTCDGKGWQRGMDVSSLGIACPFCHELGGERVISNCQFCHGSIYLIGEVPDDWIGSHPVYRCWECAGTGQLAVAGSCIPPSQVDRLKRELNLA